MDSEELVIPVVGVIIFAGVVGASIMLWRRFRISTLFSTFPSDKRTFWSAITLFFLVNLLIIILGVSFDFLPFGRFFSFRLSNLFTIPLRAAEDSLVFIAGALIVRRLFANQLPSPFVPVSDVITQIVRRIWRSETFLTVLDSVIPKGADDAKYGIDYIPFMLYNIEKRRDRYRRSSKAFLRLTMTLGIAFSVLVVGFGYVVLNDVSAGTPRILNDLRTELKEAKETADLLTPGYLSSTAFSSGPGKYLDQIESSAPPTLKPVVRDSLFEGVKKFRADLNFVNLLNTIDDALKEVQGADDYRKQLIEARNALSQASSELQNAVPRLSTLVFQSDKVVADLTKEHETPEARTVELWKRIALGVTICTFLLVIIRFSSNIYKENHAQALRAEADDLLIRQFVVAFKSSGSDAQLRKDALTAFMSASATAKSADAGKEGITSDEAGLLKELIAAVAKKIG